MKRLAAVALLALTLSACGANPSAEQAAPTKPSAKSVDWPGRIATFEKENAFDTADWYEAVDRTVVAGGALTVETLFRSNAASKATALRVCGAYSTINVTYPKITTVFVRAGDGQRLAKCGPDA